MDSQTTSNFKSNTGGSNVISKHLDNMHELTKQTQLPKRQRKSPITERKDFFVDVTPNNPKSQNHRSTQSLIDMII